MDSIKQLALNLKIEQVEQITGDFTLWYHPQFDEGRKKYVALFDEIKKQYADKRVLEVGYPWGGREIPGSKVLDLYDNRKNEIDYVMDACKMDIPNDSFDLIVCNSVLEHIPKFWLAVAEMQRILAPGGIVWVSVPSVWPFHPDNGPECNYGGDYWRMNHQSLPAVFDRCEKIATWYLPAAPSAGDDPRSGWGVVFVGQKIK